MGENSNSSTNSQGTTTTTIGMNTMNTTNNNNINMQSTADYLALLLKDKKQLAAFPNVFHHLDRLLEEEIAKVRSSLFHINGVEKKPLVLPEAEGPITSRQEKVYVPVEEHPEYNFVGRILGPRGMTAKQLEQETGCKIMVRGRGSMRDKKKEEQNRGKPNWEHLNDKLHVLITVEDSPNRANIKIQRAVEEVKKLLIPVTEGEDELKKRQLMELAIINGTYRDSSQRNSIDAEMHKMAQTLTPVALTSQLRASGTPLGAPLILSSRIPVPTSAGLLTNGGGPQQLLAPSEAQIIYSYPDIHSQYFTSPLLAEFPTAAQGTGVVESSAGNTAGKEKRQRTTTNRFLPYDTVTTQRPAS